MVETIPIPDPPPNGQVSLFPNQEDGALFLEASSEAVVVVDQAGCIVSLNPTAQQLFGRMRDLGGRTIHEVVGCVEKDEKGASACPFTRMMRTGEVTMIPGHGWIREDGMRFDLSLSFWPRTVQGTRVGGLIMVRDLTHAMEAERDIQRVARLAEDAPNPIVEFDETGAMLYANTGTLNVMTECNVLEAGIEAIFPPTLLEILRQCLVTNTPLSRIEHAVADRTLAWSFFPLKASEQVRAYGLDITSDVALRRASQCR